MESKWTIRGYNEDDENEVFELWKAVYGVDEQDRGQWLRSWRWKYGQNPAGAGKIWVAEHDGRLVGLRALLPMDISIHGETVRAFQSVDVMTHPGFRRQGISLALGRHALEEARRSGVGITLAPSNEAAYRFHYLRIQSAIRVREEVNLSSDLGLNILL